MRIPILLTVLFCACASAPRPEAVQVAPEVASEPLHEIALPPPPPITPLDPLQVPQDGSLERDAALADRFTDEKQHVGYRFEARRGELSLFGLMTWGYARGWHSRAKISIVDEKGVALLSEPREGGAAWFAFMPFVAPEDGVYRYQIELEEGYFRYRLARHSSYRPREAGAIEDIGAAAHVDGFLASGSDEIAYRIHVEAGQRIDLKLLNAEEDGRKERRTSTPARLRRGMQSGFVHPSFALTVELDGVDQNISGHYGVLQPARAGECIVRVRAGKSGDGGRFELALTRAPELCEVAGSVSDREGAGLAGVELEFLRGADRDPTGRAQTGAMGEFRLGLPPGPYRVVMSKDGATAAHVASCTVFGGRVLDLVWMNEPLSEEDEIEPMRMLSRALAPR